MVTIYFAQPEFIPRRSFLFLCILMYLYNSKHIVLHQTRSHSFIRSWAVVLLSFFPLKKSDREVQSLAALYPTVRQVRKNIHSRVWTLGTTWSLLHPGGPPLLVPLSSWWLGDMGLTHGDWSGLLSRVATHGTSRSCPPPPLPEG